MNQVLIVIVNKDQSSGVIQISKSAGAKGGTILRGKGASIFEKKGFLGLDIEVDKDVVLIISKEDNIQLIMETLNKEFKFDEPNSGIAFVLNTEKVIGIIQDD